MKAMIRAIAMVAMFTNLGILATVTSTTAQTASNVICNGCINSRDIKNGAVTGVDIKDGSVGAGDLAGSILPKASTTTGPVLAPSSQSQFTFIGSTKVSLLAGQSVLVFSTAGLGAKVSSKVNLANCYQSTVAGSVIFHNVGVYDLNLPANDLRMFSFTSLLAPPAPGEFLVGLCGMRGVNALDYNDYFEVVAVVLGK